MESLKINPESELFICFPAYLQFYYFDNKNLTYEKLFYKILQYIKNDQELYNFLTNLTLYEEIKTLKYQKFKLKYGFDKIFTNRIKDLLKEFFNELTYVSERHLEILMNAYNNSQKFIFYNDNPLHVLIDELIITNFPNKTMINGNLITFYTTSELLELISLNNNAKNYIIMNQKISTLLFFHNIGCWTILLTPIVYSYHDIKQGNLDEVNEIYDIVQANCQYLKNNEKFFSFSSSNFYQLAFYYNEIQKINLLNSSSPFANLIKLKEKLENEIKPIRVLVFIRILTRLQVFKKQRLFFSNNQVIYYSHVGGEDASLNKEKFDFILVKAVEMTDCLTYSKHLENFLTYSLENKVYMTNDLRNFKYFVEKDLMSEFLTDFVNSEEIKDIQKKFNISLRFPKSFTIELQDIMNKEKFLNYLKENKIKFPLIIKYKGLLPLFKHLISFVFEERYVDNFVEYLKNIKMPEKKSEENFLNAKCVIQNFMNHGGCVLKFYRLNKQNFLDYRSSLPDLCGEFLSRHVDGYWNFKTIDLEAESFIKNWKTYSAENQIQKILNEKDAKNFKFLNEISNQFEKFSKFTLFGLDFLYDIEGHKEGKNDFYIFDCNALPSYKIQNIDDLSQCFRNHFVSIYKNNN